MKRAAAAVLALVAAGLGCDKGSDSPAPCELEGWSPQPAERGHIAGVHADLRTVTVLAEADCSPLLQITASTDPPGPVELSLEPGPVVTARAAVGREVAGTQLSVALGEGEQVRGLGEHFDSPDSRGLLRELFIRPDAGMPSGTNEVHVPVPFAWIHPRGAGLLVTTRTLLRADAGATDEDALVLSATGPEITARLYPHDPIARYHEDTGQPRGLPDWALFNMHWRDANSSGAEVLEDARRLRAEGIPTSTIWIDSPWARAYNDFVFNEQQFPDPEGLIAELSDLGFKVVLWSTSFINTDSHDGDVDRYGVAEAADEMLAEATAGGHLLLGWDGLPLALPWWKGRGFLPDLLAERSQSWWRAKVDSLHELGVAGWKLDDGEILDSAVAIGVDVRHADGTPFNWVNGYKVGYHRAYEGAEFVVSRTGTVGSQSQFSAVWPGDLDNDLSEHAPDNVGGLPAAVAAASSLADTGFPHFAPDIGGYRGGQKAEADLLKWIPFGALCPVMQNGGKFLPWGDQHSEAVLESYRRWAVLHARLFPYLKVDSGIRGLGRKEAYLLGPDLHVSIGAAAPASGEWVDWIEDAGVSLRVRRGAMVPLLVTVPDTVLPAADPTVSSLQPSAPTTALLAGPEAVEQYDAAPAATRPATTCALGWASDAHAACPGLGRE